METPDTELLERFVARQEESAFEELLQRHGPMVLALCRRILRNSSRKKGQKGQEQEHQLIMISAPASPPGARP